MIKLAEFRHEISALPPQTINEVQKEIFIMTSRSAAAKCLLYSLVLFLALAAPNANAQAGIPQGYMQYPSGNLVVGSTITFTCTVSDVGNAPPSEFANGITVSGPDGYVTHGGTAVAEGGQDIVTYKTTLPYAGTYETWCLGGLAEANTVTFTVSAAPVGVQGYIDPKYVVVGVTYAPPGSSSNVTYTNTTSVGNTTTISSSFSNDVGFSVSDTIGGKISAGWFSGGFKITATESTDYTQGSSSSTTTTISKASTVAYKTSGTPTEAPVNSDYDYIWLWLNPELFMTYTPATGSNPESIVLNGYGMDPNDPATGLPQTGVTYTAGPDVVEVQVGCLNGHFSCGSDLGWNSGEAPGSFITSGLLARSWQSAAKGYDWPSGEQSGLSFNDVCQILTFDPLATTPAKCTTQNDYKLLNTLPSTTTDGRFSKIPYPPNPIQYPIGGANESYSMVQTDTLSQSTGNSTQIKQAFSVSEQFSTSAFWGLVSNTITFKQSDTLTWNYSSLNTITTTTTLTDALSITGPPDTPTYPSNEPVEFIGYQDNTFGTFAFVPVDYCPSGSILCTQ